MSSMLFHCVARRSTVVSLESEQWTLHVCTRREKVFAERAVAEVMFIKGHSYPYIAH